MEFNEKDFVISFPMKKEGFDTEKIYSTFQRMVEIYNFNKFMTVCRDNDMGYIVMHHPEEEAEQ